MSRQLHRRQLLAVAAVVVLAGCAAPMADDRLGQDGLGEVDGVGYADELSITVEDGLNESERDVFVKRAMARMEVVRGLAYQRTVDVEVITREEYQNSGGGGNETVTAWRNQFWEALFAVGEDRDATAVREENRGSSVQGYYTSRDEQIVLISDSETPTIDKRTLVHELAHALQDQQFGLGSDADTHDEFLAYQGLVEGEASRLDELYLRRCGVEWNCLRPETDGGDTSRDLNLGLFRVSIQPYKQGLDFIAAIRDRGGWEAVDDLYGQVPESTEQIIHPEKYPDESPQEVAVADASSEEWSRFDYLTTDTMGEASMYVMLANNGAISVGDRFDYRHEATEGWGGDTFVPYRNDGEFGYVWETEWDTEADAEEFARAYRLLLERFDVVERGQNALVIQDGPFADAFRVTREGSTVRIVNGPSTESLSEIHG